MTLQLCPASKEGFAFPRCFARAKDFAMCVCVYACMCVCVYVCMYACMYVIACNCM